ncbi:MAG: EMC3/TMCO1 family protein [bacterium]
MADAAPAPPRQKMSLLTIASLVAVFLVLFNPQLRGELGRYAGFVMEPLIGFGGHLPVLTILLAGAILVVASTVVRHFTTDWLETARTQQEMRHFQREMMKARKENNTYKIKVLTELQPKMMAKSQKLQGAQLRTMPLTMILAVPLFAWLGVWLYQLDYTWYSAPWNANVDMFTTNGIVPPWNTSVFPHWVLLYICLSIPLGSWVQKAMKYLSWKERWQKRHPEAHG